MWCIDQNLALLVVLWVGAVGFTCSVSAGDVSDSLPTSKWWMVPLFSLIPGVHGYRRWPADGERRKYFTLILCVIIPRKEYVLLFSFPSIARIFAIPSLLEQVFLQAITQSVLGFVGTLFCSLVLCSQELETVFWLFFYLAAFPPSPLYLCTHSLVLPEELSEV